MARAACVSSAGGSWTLLGHVRQEANPSATRGRTAQLGRSATNSQPNGAYHPRRRGTAADSLRDSARCLWRPEWLATERPHTARQEAQNGRRTRAGQLPPSSNVGGGGDRMVRDAMVARRRLHPGTPRDTPQSLLDAGKRPAQNLSWAQPSPVLVAARPGDIEGRRGHSPWLAVVRCSTELVGQCSVICRSCQFPPLRLPAPGLRRQVGEACHGEST